MGNDFQWISTLAFGLQPCYYLPLCPPKFPKTFKNVENHRFAIDEFAAENWTPSSIPIACRTRSRIAKKHNI
jgi:hypothetical protein